jgi:hypothetical protein
LTNKTQIENKILDLVSFGIKGQDLITRLMEFDLVTTQNEFYDVIFDMLAEGQLVEIEYVLPNHVSKSFLIPKGTKINVVNRRLAR